MNLRKPEILAPAGTYEAMEAAVKAGCDAVYAGGSLFSARANAGNFDEEEFIKAIEYCHLFGVRVYMALNTLLKESEIRLSADGYPGDHIVRYVTPYYRAGLDAVLVQDPGVLKILKENFPGLPVHSSTQMSISSAYGAQLAKDLGFERIVPARELSLNEIISIKEKVGIEIETFVHGAMCFSYSGKCLFSSFAGGRSGNRGRCAQPCRMRYRLASESRNGKQRPEEYVMSLKDLCMIHDLPLLIDAGIDSFKIEGRRKNPYYVAHAADAYRQARDLYLSLKNNNKGCAYAELDPAAQEEYLNYADRKTDELRDIYNRGGFYNGYYFTFKGPEMSALKRANHTGLKVGTVERIKAPEIAIRLEKDLGKQDIIELLKTDAEGRFTAGEEGIELTSSTEGKAGGLIRLKGKELKRISPNMAVYRTRNHSLLSDIEKEILNSEKSISVKAQIEARIGSPLQITLRAEDPAGTFVQVSGDPVTEAEKAPVTEDVLTGKMKKSKGSGIRVEEVECIIDPNAFLSMSGFNALRHKAAEELKEKIVGRYHRQS